MAKIWVLRQPHVSATIFRLKNWSIIRGANSELVYHERQCWYCDYTIFRCQREFRLHTPAGLGTSDARTESPMAFKLHISSMDPLMWCVTELHMHPLTLPSLLGTIPLFSQWGHCRTTTRRKIIYKIYWMNAHTNSLIFQHPTVGSQKFNTLHVGW